MERVPFALHGAVAGARLAADMAGLKNDDLLARRDDAEAAEREAVRLLSARRGFEAQMDAVEADGASARAAVEDLRSRLEVGEKGAPLSPDAQEFMRALRADGIEPTPLPDVVDVTESGWAMAPRCCSGPGPRP